MNKQDTSFASNFDQFDDISLIKQNPEFSKNISADDFGEINLDEPNHKLQAELIDIEDKKQKDEIQENKLILNLERNLFRKSNKKLKMLEILTGEVPK